MLLHWAGRLSRSSVPAELQLDVLEAASKRGSAELKQALEAFEKRRLEGDVISPYRIALAGGDAGPNLSRISATAERQHLLAS